jgi:dephospho-CoA kinase
MSISNNLPEIIGIAGTFASGKDTLAQVLAEEYGFTHISTSDMVREAAMERYGSIERPILHKVATELRTESGAGTLVKKALQHSRPMVVTGIRSLGEAKELKAAGGVMIYTDADPRRRYERIKMRSRDSETTLSLEQFLANEEKEMHGGDREMDFNIRAIGEMADIRLMNDGTPEEFLAEAIERLSKV